MRRWLLLTLAIISIAFGQEDFGIEYLGNFEDGEWQINEIFIDDSLLYILDARSDLYIANISIPYAPELIATIPSTLGNSLDIYVSEQRLFIADYRSGMRIYDVTNPESPEYLTTYDAIYGIRQIIAQDSILYLLDARAFKIIDISDVYSPVELYYYSVEEWFKYVDISDSLALVINQRAPEYDIVLGFNITNPCSAYFIGENEVSLDVEIEICDGFFLLPGYDGIWGYQTSFPFSRIGFFNNNFGYTNINYWAGIAICGHGIVSSDWPRMGIRLLDISDFSSPVVEASYATENPVLETAVKDSFIYAAGWEDGVYLFKYTDFESTTEHPTTPTALNLTAHPNPFNSSVEIDAPDGYTVTITDTDGRHVATLGTGSNRWIPVSGQPSGIYIVKAEGGDEILTQRIVYMK